MQPPPQVHRKGKEMTVRILMTTGEYKIYEAVDLEVDPVTNTSMTVRNGVLHIKESE